MANDNNRKQALAVFETIYKTLDNNDWRYEKDEEKLSITCSARGDDLPMELQVNVDEKRMIIVLNSLLPFRVPEEKKIDAAIAISLINYMLVDGSFDYNPQNGAVFFRMTNSYCESLIGEDLCEYMLFCSCQIVDEFNDKLLMLCKGILSLEKFIEAVGN